MTRPSNGAAQPAPQRRCRAHAAAVAGGALLAAAAAQAGVTDRDWMAPVQRAPQVEAPALLSGIGGADAHTGGNATLSALLDRLRVGVPAAAAHAARVPGANGVDPDCALFADSLRVRLMLGAVEGPGSVDAFGPAGATRLDVPFRCLDRLPRAAPPPALRRALGAEPDPGLADTVRPRRPLIEASDGVVARWWKALAGTAAALTLAALVHQAWRRWSGW